jgi:PAS domain S-box-containing protein
MPLTADPTQLPIRARITLAVALALAVLGAVALVSYRSVGILVDTSAWVGHTHEVLATLESLLGGVITAETGVRGYVVTGEDRFLGTYWSGMQHAESNLAALRRLTADNPEQQERLARLEPLVAERLLTLQETSALRREQGRDAAAERVRLTGGSGLDTSIRGLIDEMRAAERVLLDTRVVTASAMASRTRWIIAGGSVVVVMITLGSIVLIGREVERRRRMDRGRRAAEARYRQLFDRNLAGMARTRRADGTVLECNPAMARILGYGSREEVLGLNARDLYVDLADRKRIIAGVAPGGGLVDQEVRFRRKNGDVIWVSMTSVELEDDGQPAFEALVLDVTERRNAREQIEALNAALARQVGELDVVNRELDAFSYSISHDLRAPLRAMQGFSEALLEDYGDRLDATGHDYAQRIVGASQQMDALIQDLLAYSRLVRTEIALDPVSLETVVDEACGSLEREVKELGGEIAVERPLGRVLAHRAVLGQIVGNLLTNALKFTRPEAPPRVRIHAERAPGRVRLWVEDNGIGIAAEHRERIFRAFERLHGLQQYPGTGIGLAIVQKGALRLGGQAGVESEPGTGSRFWVDLREAEAPAA